MSEATARRLITQATRPADATRQSGPVRRYDPQTGGLLETIPFAEYVERPSRRHALARMWREPISKRP